MPKSNIKYFFVVILSAAVFTAACAQTSDKLNENSENIISAPTEVLYFDDITNFNTDNILIENEIPLENISVVDKSDAEIIEDKNFDYRKFYFATEGFALEQAAYLNGNFYYMLGKTEYMAQFSSSFELYSYNIYTDEKKLLYEYSGSQYYQLVAFENELFWIIADDTSKIIKYDLLTDSVEIFKETNGFIVLNTSEIYLIWDEFKHEGDFSTYIYNTETKEIKEIAINNRYINSPYYGVNIIDDIIIYPMLENDTYYMVGIDINETDNEVLRIELPSEVAGFSAYDQNIIWTNTFFSPEVLIYLYDIEKNLYYILNKQGESVFGPKITNNYIAWTNSEHNSLYLLDIKEWVKYIIPVNENTFTYVSSKGEIYTISNGTCGVLL